MLININLDHVNVIHKELTTDVPIKYVFQWFSRRTDLCSSVVYGHGLEFIFHAFVVHSNIKYECILLILSIPLKYW